jgi:hypothetical protein
VNSAQEAATAFQLSFTLKSEDCRLPLAARRMPFFLLTAHCSLLTSSLLPRLPLAARRMPFFLLTS